MLQAVSASIAGVLVVAIAIRDIFQTLFHPAGRGHLSGWISRAAWQVVSPLARRRPSLLRPLGPLLLIATAASWVLLLVTGWALVLWPHLPGSFLVAPGLSPSDHEGLLDALYLSLVTLTTLGYGDLAPSAEWLRLILPLEAVVGFGVLTAVISWIVSIYGSLGRRRSLAREAAIGLEAALAAGVAPDELEDAPLERLLTRLTTGLVAVREDLVNFPGSFYFHSPDPRSSLARYLLSLLTLSRKLERRAGQGIGLANRAFRIALDDLALHLGETFLELGGRPTREILTAYAEAHERTDALELEAALFGGEAAES